MFPENRLLELMIIGAVALIVVGPKDLPVLMRRIGQFVAKMRGMAAEFRASFDELARQSELEELRREVEAMRADHRAFAPLNPIAPDQAAGGYSPPETPPPQPAATTPAEVTAPDPAPPKPPRPRRPRAKKPSGEAS
jgi:sec-independent protein translocase protein TatB